MENFSIWCIALASGVFAIGIALILKAHTNDDLTFHENIFKNIIGPLMGKHYLRSFEASSIPRKKADWFWGNIYTIEVISISFVASWKISARYQSHAYNFNDIYILPFLQLLNQQLKFKDIYIDKNISPPSDPKSIIIPPRKPRSGEVSQLVPSHPNEYTYLREQMVQKENEEKNKHSGINNNIIIDKSNDEPTDTINISLYAPNGWSNKNVVPNETLSHHFQNARLLQKFLSLELPGTDVIFGIPSLEKFATISELDVIQTEIRPICFWLHGGGLVALSTAAYDRVLRRLSSLIAPANAVVISIDYRLAPEHRFPIPMEDCLYAITEVVQLAPALGLDASRIAICGDSAGGALVASVIGEAIRLPELYFWIENVKHVSLIYPSLCRLCPTASHLINGTEKGLKYDIWYGLMHTSTLGLPVDWRQSPFEIPMEILSKFPSTSMGLHGFFGADRWSTHGVNAVQWVADQLITQLTKG